MTAEEFKNSGFQSLLGEGCSVSAVRVGAGKPLHVEESALLSPKAKNARRLTLEAGRDALRRALRAQGVIHDGPILRGPRGEPLLPPGVHASLSHSGDWSVAAATVSETVAGLGIDIQVELPGDRERLRQRIASAAEIQWIGKSSSNLLMLFSMKEAFYKAAVALIGRYIGFREVEIYPSPERGNFDLVPCAQDIESILMERTIELRSGLYADYIFSVCRIIN